MCEKSNKRFLHREGNGDTYDYSKVQYTNNSSKVTIVCSVHGDFLKSPGNHIGSKQGCPACGNSRAGFKHRTDLDTFTKQAREVHGSRYDYSEAIYVNNQTKLTIKCDKHGAFPQRPANHLSGNGCPHCRSSKGETKIRVWLEEKGIEFEQQKKYPDLIGKVRELPFDFYIPSKNMVIEFDGKQHFEPNEKFGGESAFVRTQLNDAKKNRYCKKNGIRIERIVYQENTSKILEGMLLY